MCGIVGYIGDRNVIPVLIGGLQKLEYRGYDSAGIAYLDDGRMTLYKEKGKLAGLEKMVAGKCAEHTVGIGHTRWATHGEPNQKNAHPHINEAGDLALSLIHICAVYAKTAAKCTAQRPIAVINAANAAETLSPARMITNRRCANASVFTKTKRLR